MNITTIPITKINPAEYNPRTITKDEFSGLVESLKTFGQQENLIVNKDMTLISGHQRLEAMKSLKWTEAVCNVVDLDKHEEKKLNVLMNSQAISGTWDDLKLAEILEEMKLDDNYESLRLNELEPLDLSPTEVEEDEAPEVSSEPPKSKLGEIYQLGRHRVMCEDSTVKENVELLMDGAKADMVFTDPPYGINEDGDRSKRGGLTQGNRLDSFIDDSIEYAIKAFDIVDTMNIPKQVWFGANYYAHHIPQTNNWLVWDKRVEEKQTDTQSDCELAWVKTDASSVRIFRHLWKGMMKDSERGQRRVHPTQKPVELAAWAFNQYKGGSNVLDLFLGSGSTLIACEQTDRTCYGMELDPKYTDVIRKRWVKYVHGEEALENDRWTELTPVIG